MSSLPAHEGKFKFGNYISMQVLTTNNKRFQIMTAKSAASNNTATNTPDNNEPISTVTYTKRLYSCKSERISKDTNNNESLSLVTYTKCLHSHASNCISEDNEDNNSESEVGTTLPAVSTKHLARCKTAHAAIERAQVKRWKRPLLLP